MVKKGLLDKHGKPNEKTPKDYLKTYEDYSAKTAVKTETAKKEEEGESDDS
jgi:H/ACA ribonucleoprotein complex subunit 4